MKKEKNVEVHSRGFTMSNELKREMKPHLYEFQSEDYQ